MKTTILADGTLSVAPESDLEAFALNCWCEKNINPDWFNAAANCAPPPKIIVDLSAYTDRIGLFFAGSGMSEFLILTAIVAPIVLVPAFILSFHSYVAPLSWPDVLIELPAADESDFVRFHREMIEKIAASVGIPKEWLTEPYDPVGFSYFAAALKRDAKRYGGWR